MIVKEQKVEVKSESVIGDWVGDDNAGDAEEDKSGGRNYRDCTAKSTKT